MPRLYITSDLHLDSLVHHVFGGTYTRPSTRNAVKLAKEERMWHQRAINALFLQGMFRSLPPSDPEGTLVLAGDIWTEHKMFGFHSCSWIAHVCSLFKHVVVVAGNHCLDMNTELLTKRGWLKYEDIKMDDEVYSLDPLSSQGIWTTIERKFKRKNDGKMLAYKSSRLEFRTTPEHRFIAQKMGCKDVLGAYVYLPAEGMHGDLYIPNAAIDVAGRGVALSDSQLRLFGWILSDGCISTNKRGYTSITISQSKPGHDIEELLQCCGISYTKSVRNRKITSVCGRLLKNPPYPEQVFSIAAMSRQSILEWLPNKKQMPKWVEKVTKEQFDVLLGGIISGNGVWTKSGNAACIHGRKEFLDSLQAACVTKGWRSTMSVARGKDFRLNISNVQRTQVASNFKLEEEVSQEDVWCVTVPHGNFMCRLGGKAYFTGNCNWGTMHGTWHAKAERLKQEQGLYNLHILENSFIDLDEVRFIGATLWTDMNNRSPFAIMDSTRAMNDFQYIKKLTPNVWLREHQRSRDYIKHVLDNSADKKCVVVTHHAPCYNSISQHYRASSSSAYYWSDLTDLMFDRDNLPLWVHGHTHNVSDYEIDKTRVVCYPVGYENFNPNFVIVDL